MNDALLIEDPFFITEEVEAEMIKSGYVFEPPKHICIRPTADERSAVDDDLPPTTP